jgi:hypothetical protein
LLIQYLDSRVDDLTYRPDLIIEKQRTWGRRAMCGANVDKLASELRKEGVFPSMSTAEIAAQYLLDEYYPALERCFQYLGLTAAGVHLVNITLSNNRQLHARVLVTCADYDHGR